MKRWMAIALLGMTACQSNSTEMVELKDLTEMSTEDSTVHLKDSIAPNYWDSIPSRHQTIAVWVDSTIERATVWDTQLIVERFENKAVHRWQTERNKWLAIAYRDSLATKNAFFNWLDCFSPKCLMVTPFQRKIPLNIPFLWAVSSESLYYIEGPTSKWDVQTMTELENKTKGTRWLYLAQCQNGRLTWWIKNEDKWQRKTEFN